MAFKASIQALELITQWLVAILSSARELHARIEVTNAEKLRRQHSNREIQPSS